MPIYEYLCSSCGESFSKLQRMGAGDEGIVCPSCGSAEVKRQISSCSIGGGSSFAAGPSCSIGGG